MSGEFCGVWVGRLVSCFRGFGYGVGWVGWLFEFADLVVWFMVGYGGLGDFCLGDLQGGV